MNLEKFTLKLKIDTDRKVNPSELSIYTHAILLDILPAEIADQVHNAQTNPYSQHCYYSQGDYYWEINILEQQIAEELRSILFSAEFQSFNVNQWDDLLIKIESKSLRTLNQSDLADIFYRQEAKSQFNLIFDTPTSFKSDEKYIFYPDLRLIIQSMMFKYNYFFETEDFDEKFLNKVLEKTKITSYKCQSHYFKVHGYAIPAFRGEIRMTCWATDSVKKYLDMLLKFGEFSGVGMKTGLGMGSIRYLS